MAALFTLFLFSSSLTKKTIEESINHQEPEQKLSFHAVSFIEIQKVCQDRVILDFKIWYEAYIPKYLQKHSFVPAFDLNNNLKTGVDNHINQLRDYLSLLEGQKEDMKKFAPLFLDIKIRKLIEDINKILHDKEDQNPFAAPELQEQLKNTAGHYLPELIQDFNNKILDTDLISALGDAFRADWDRRNLNIKDPISIKVEELAEPLRRSLRSIIAAFTDPTSLVYNSLGDNKKNIIHFYTVFKYLLDPEERKLLIAKGLVPTSPVKLGKPPGFLTSEIFNKLTENPHSFVDVINRDKFLTLNDPDTDLETIHDAARPFFFSSDFPDVLLSDPKDLGLDDPIAKKLFEGPEGRAKRKKANLDRLLYQVYVMARADGTIPPNKPIDNQKLLSTLKDWVEQTDVFDEELPIVSELLPLEEESIKDAPLDSKKSDPKNRFQQLIPPPVFKRFYVPLLKHICDKINGCNFNKMTDEPEFIKKYEKFGNFEDMNKDNALASLIPTEILDKIHDKLADKKVAELDEQLDTYFDDFEPYDEQELEDLGGQNFSGRFDSPKLKPKQRDHEDQHEELITVPEEIIIEEEVLPTVLEQSTVKKLENDGVVVHCPAKVEPMRVKSRANRVKQAKVEAINPLLNQFIPINKPVDEKGKKIIDKLIDKAETATAPEKEATMKTLLLKFIMQRIQEKTNTNESPANEMTIIDHVNKRLVDKLLGSFSFLETKGIRNFFEKEKNRLGGMRFGSENPLDFKFFKFDAIFFYFFAAEAKAARAQKEGKSGKELAKELIDVSTAGKSINTRFQLGLTSPVEIRAKLKSIVYSNIALMERMPAYEFFVAFLDFFNYFENIKGGSDAEYANYSTVFMNFYQFLIRVRSTISYKIENPHAFTLNHLERCLVYTEDVVVTSLKMVDEVCVFSHRKYAEMYYFYKLYLISKNKIEGLTLAPYQGRSLDTHVRIFMNFAYQNTDFSSKLTDLCKGTTLPICVTWDLFDSLIGYLHDKTEASDSIIPAFRKYYNADNNAMKFAFIAAFESVYINVANGNMINWNRYQQMVFELKKNGMDVTKFDERDLELLTNYYTRTYKKLIFSQQEETVSRVVRRILAVVPTEDKTGSLMYFIPHYNTYYHFDGAKFFLLLSQTQEEFRTIAQATIEHNQGHALFEMNNFKSHGDLITFINDASTASSENEVIGKIKSFIDSDYENTKGRSRMCVESELRSDGIDEDEEALLQAFMEELASNGSEADKETGDLIQKELAKPNNQPNLIVSEQIIKVQVDSESRIAQTLGFDLEKENVIHLNEGETIPANLEKIIQGKIKLNDEDLSPEQLQQALNLKAQFMEALGQEMLEQQLANPTDTHSGILNGDLNSPTNQEGKRFARKKEAKKKKNQLI